MDLRKKSIVTALMVAMFLAAVEGTIVTIAAPTITTDLGGFDLISLVFSVYFLTTAVSTPIYGRLADLYGRKIVLTVGIFIFLTGSVLCGLSRTMAMLIAFRAVQGLGAGSIITITYTIVGDVFTLQERPKVQGGLSTVWGIASLAGPFIGGFFIDVLSWHWVFFINLPFGIVSVILLQKSLMETPSKKKHRIDYAGTIVFSAAIILLLNLFLSTGSFGVSRGLFIGLTVSAAALLLFLFYIIERNATEPMIPFEIFTKTSVIVNLISFVVSAVLIGVSVYLPIYLQNVLSLSATLSGLTLAPMSAAWLLSSVFLGKQIERLGGKVVILISILFIAAGSALLTSLTVLTPVVLVILYVFVLGVGFGGTFTTLTIVIQSSVTYGKRGAAVAANTLLRTLGQTIGVSVLGIIFNFAVGRYFQQIGIIGVDPRNLYTSAAAELGVTEQQTATALSSATGRVSLVLLALSVLCVILILLTPKISCKEPDDAVG